MVRNCWNEPVRKRDSTAESEADTEGDRKRLLALNHPQRRDTIYTKDKGTPRNPMGTFPCCTTNLSECTRSENWVIDFMKRQEHLFVEIASSRSVWVRAVTDSVTMKSSISGAMGSL